MTGRNITQDFNRGTVRANQLTFEYLTQGDGPLALCMHGFSDSPHSYRYLLPALAEAGYRAVAPFNRGFAPTELHEGLGCDSDAILIAHDWGTVGAGGQRDGGRAAVCGRVGHGVAPVSCSRRRRARCPRPPSRCRAE
jgi:pimeloyl-ACP methyl ester carboxylesterase